MLLKVYRRCIDQSGVCGMALMDLSRPYECLPHESLLAKLLLNDFFYDMQHFHACNFADDNQFRHTEHPGNEVG